MEFTEKDVLIITLSSEVPQPGDILVSVNSKPFYPDFGMHHLLLKASAGTLEGCTVQSVDVSDYGRCFTLYFDSDNSTDLMVGNEIGVLRQS